MLFGLVVGVLIGLTGVGGGSLMTPLLLLAGGYSPVVTIGTDLAYGAVTKTVGGWRHLRAGHVDVRLSWWLAAGSVPGALAGVVTLNRLDDAYGPQFEPYLLGAVAGALMLAASATLYRARVPAGPGGARARVRRPAAAAEQGRDRADRAGARLHPRPHLGRLRARSSGWR